MPPTSVAYQQHDHQHCIDSALQTAKKLCRERGVRLTPQRERVLQLIWQSHQPLGAYQLMAMLAERSDRTIAPPTIYRALDFLVEQAFVHKLHSINAFVGCSQPTDKHQSHFLICTHCQAATEFGGDQLSKAISDSARAERFSVQAQSLEILGVCPRCQTANTAHIHHG